MRPEKKGGRGVNSYPLLMSSNIPFQNQKHPWFSLVILTPFKAETKPLFGSRWAMKERGCWKYFGYCYKGW